MAIQIAAAIAVIAVVQQFAKIPMITRLLEAWSHKTKWTTWDDVLVDALCDVEPTEIPAVVAKVQLAYNEVKLLNTAPFEVATPEVIHEAVIAQGVPLARSLSLEEMTGMSC